MKIDSTGVAAVDPTYYWNRDMSACPQGAKVQLRTRYGIAIHGAVSAKNRDCFTGWTALPTEAKDDERTSIICEAPQGATKEYSEMLYVLADQLEQAGHLSDRVAEFVREAAQRLDEQTVTINVLCAQVAQLSAGKEG